ncbi:MAG: hypothetical protein ACKO63_12095 [Nodosilinea sp.]
MAFNRGWGVGMAIALIPLIFPTAGLRADTGRRCQFDPTLGRPNPLGMRAYITLTETGGDTIVEFEQFPSLVEGGEVPATLAVKRVMTFYGWGLTATRQLLLDQPRYYSELLGYQDTEGFGSINDLLTCSPY